MNRLGKYLTKEMDSFDWNSSIHELAILENNYKFDMINCSFVLEEILSPKDRLLLVETLIEKLAPNGFITFVFVGSPMGFRYMHDIRQIILKKSREDFNILGPCPHHLECPLLNSTSTWCHFEQSWPRYSGNIIPRDKSERNIIKSKFCYITIRKGLLSTGINSSNIELIKSFKYSRIINSVIKRDGHNILDLCNNFGKIERRIVARSFENIYGYKESKKLEWGDLWKYPLRLSNKYKKEEKGSINII